MMVREVVSIEKVLNSRCSSSFERDGTVASHWGSFLDKPLSEKTKKQILDCCNKIPRLSNEPLSYWFKDGKLFLGFEKPSNSYTERLLHIESGMQQEAVYLTCAALGIGTCILNQGINGTEYDNKIATASHLLMEIRDPYNLGKFTTKSPGPKKSFKLGKKLIEPSRDGDVECLPQLTRLNLNNISGSSASHKDVSQLLWAAKGRTPHYIRKHAWKTLWGLTIPTWAGVENYTSVYLIKSGELFSYINWTKSFSLINRLFRTYFNWTRGNPTHDLRFVKKINAPILGGVNAQSIVLCRNEKTNRALWEVGYMLENLFLQTKSLDISYDCKVFTADEASQLAELGLESAVAALLL